MLIRREIEGMDQMDLLHKIVVQDKEATVLVPNIKKFVKEFKDRFKLDISYRLISNGKSYGGITHVKNDEGKVLKVYPYEIFPKEKS